MSTEQQLPERAIADWLDRVLDAFGETALVVDGNGDRLVTKLIRERDHVPLDVFEVLRRSADAS